MQPTEVLTAEMFLAKIKNAGSWSLSRELIADRFRLIVTNSDGVRSYLSPDQLSMSLEDYTSFLAQLEKIAGDDIYTRNYIP